MTRHGSSNRHELDNAHGSRAGAASESPNRHGFAGFLFTLPFMVLFVTLFIAPLIYALYLSLYREQLVGGNAFVGLDNYTEGLKDKAFTDGVKRVALFMVVQVPIMLFLALVFALIIDSGKVIFAQALPRRVLRALRRADRDRGADVGLPVRARLRPVRRPRRQAGHRRRRTSSARA